jgi:RNA polymerase sigma-70 factor (ECF subfamily)
LDDRTDEQLFADYRRGQADAFRALIERHHDDLLRFLIRLVGNRQAAEDVFQEAFLQIHTSGDSFDMERRFRPWLFTIAANKGRDWLRRKGRRQMMELSAPVSGPRGDDSTTFIDLLQVEWGPPSGGMEAGERDRQVQEALAGMSHPLREILLLSYFNRLTYQQIAEELGIPLGTVKSRLHAAVASFAKRWQEVVRKSGGEE